MKAYEVQNEWGIDSIVEVEREKPKADPGQVVVGIKACSLNYRDLLTVQGKGGAKLPLVPFSLGLYGEGAALFFMLPALVILFLSHWRVARDVLGAEQGRAIAIVLFAALLSFSIDQIFGFMLIPAGEFAG